MPDDVSRYRSAGVDLGRAEASLEAIRAAVESTYRPEVLAGIGAFGGLFALPQRPDLVLVASTDGVGTKTLLAAARGSYRPLGHDLVNHCVNDILVQGARPLFLQDYLASARLEPEIAAEVVAGLAEACRTHGMALLGGETAEMPGVYAAGALDLAGTIVGIVEREQIVDGTGVRPGDAVLALASNGLHTNGYSLARAVLADALDEPLGEATVAEALLVPHRSYLQAVEPLLARSLLRAMAHVTGGGIPGNLPRALPAGTGARIVRGTWPCPAIFGLIQERGQVPREEMERVFNLGAGFLLVCAPDRLGEVREACPEPVYRIGTIVAQEGVVLTDGST